MADKKFIEVDAFAEKICNFQQIDEDAANAMVWLLRTFPTADVVEQSVFEKMLENAMAIPKPMHLYIYFADEHVEKHMVTRFTDLSQTKSQFYYYEESHHEPGKGKTFRREDIQCFEVSFCPLQNWEQYLTKEKE